MRDDKGSNEKAKQFLTLLDLLKPPASPAVTVLSEHDLAGILQHWGYGTALRTRILHTLGAAKDCNNGGAEGGFSGTVMPSTFVAIMLAVSGFNSNTTLIGKSVRLCCLTRSSETTFSFLQDLGSNANQALAVYVLAKKAYLGEGLDILPAFGVEYNAGLHGTALLVEKYVSDVAQLKHVQGVSCNVMVQPRQVSQLFERSRAKSGLSNSVPRSSTRLDEWTTSEMRRFPPLSRKCMKAGSRVTMPSAREKVAETGSSTNTGMEGGSSADTGTETGSSADTWQYLVVYAFWPTVSEPDKVTWVDRIKEMVGESPQQYKGYCLVLYLEKTESALTLGQLQSLLLPQFRLAYMHPKAELFKYDNEEVLPDDGTQGYHEPDPYYRVMQKLTERELFKQVVFMDFAYAQHHRRCLAAQQAAAHAVSAAATATRAAEAASTIVKTQVITQEHLALPSSHTHPECFDRLWRGSSIFEQEVADCSCTDIVNVRFRKAGSSDDMDISYPLECCLSRNTVHDMQAMIFGSDARYFHSQTNLVLVLPSLTLEKAGIKNKDDIVVTLPEECTGQQSWTSNNNIANVTVRFQNSDIRLVCSQGLVKVDDLIAVTSQHLLRGQKRVLEGSVFAIHERNDQLLQGTQTLKEAGIRDGDIIAVTLRVGAEGGSRADTGSGQVLHMFAYVCV